MTACVRMVGLEPTFSAWFPSASIPTWQHPHDPARQVTSVWGTAYFVYRLKSAAEKNRLARLYALSGTLLYRSFGHGVCHVSPRLSSCPLFSLPFAGRLSGDWKACSKRKPWCGILESNQRIRAFTVWTRSQRAAYYRAIIDRAVSGAAPVPLRFTLPRQRGGKEGEAPIPGAGIEPAQNHGSVSIIPGAFIPPYANSVQPGTRPGIWPAIYPRYAVRFLPASSP